MPDFIGKARVAQAVRIVAEEFRLRLRGWEPVELDWQRGSDPEKVGIATRWRQETVFCSADTICRANVKRRQSSQIRT